MFHGDLAKGAGAVEIPAARLIQRTLEEQRSHIESPGKINIAKLLLQHFKVFQQIFALGHVKRKLCRADLNLAGSLVVQKTADIRE